MAEFEFEATLVRPEGVGTWTYLDVPSDLSDLLGAKGQIKVAGTINGHAFRTFTRPHGDGNHYIVINKSIRDAIQVTAGDVVHVVMEKDTAPRTVETPVDFTDRLRGNRLVKTFESLSYSRKKEYVDWIESARKPETRKRRIEDSLDMLRAGTSPKNPKK
ncbi:MAG: YdeI/OmpD-associated family protein [Anaerolineales bacterium]|nr:YdeI/OmpD-associated family protein [Anaerolineales bacterium]